MKIDSKNFVSITEANQNFSKVVKMVNNGESVIILKNNQPKYVVKEFKESDSFILTKEEKIEITAKRILKQHLYAFEELAKWLLLI